MKCKGYWGSDWLVLNWYVMGLFIFFGIGFEFGGIRVFLVVVFGGGNYL